MTHNRSKQAVHASNLTDRMTMMLRKDILQGKYPPGTRLPAGKDLGEAFGVSITVVREALSRLKSDGLIVSYQGKGVFVENDTKARPFRLATTEGQQISVNYIFELRIAIEVQAASLAATRRTAADLRAIRAALKLMQPAKASFEKALAADIEFHLAIAEATKNPLIVSFTRFLQPHLYEAVAAARANSAKNSETQIIAYEDHCAIYEAIQASDANRARLAVRRVLERSIRRLQRDA
jgi:DNA-binding FadR family transcriptional regulator